MRELSFFWVVGLICAICPIESASSATDAKAQETIARTRTTTATYSVYSWRSMNASLGDWSAEFHKGPLHRVESVFNRIVANCETMTGAALNLETGQIDRREWTAKAACGIQSLSNPLEERWLGSVETTFGVADRVKISDDVSTRTYQVLKNGAIVASTYLPKLGANETSSNAVEVSAELPDQEIFSESSLHSSFVPEKFKRKRDGESNDSQPQIERGL